MKQTEETGDVRRASRRKFTKRAVAAAVAAPAGLAALAAAQTQTKPKEPVAPPNPQTTPTPASQQQQPPSPVAAAYMEVARIRFGEHIKGEDEAERVRRDLEGNVRTAERLRSVKLENSDEPDFAFIV